LQNNGTKLLEVCQGNVSGLNYFMNYKVKIIKQIYILLFICALSLQAWRGVFTNSWNILKSYLQLHDLKRSYNVLVVQNRKMIAEVKKIKINPDSLKALKASKEFNLVNNPSNEVIIQFPD